MTVELYDMEIREIAHFNGFIIINQSYWYRESEYTEEQAKEKFLNKNNK